jgi:hypothetical protein
MKKINISRLFIKVLSLTLCLLIIYCGTQQAQLRDDDILEYNLTYSFYKTISYDKYHRPVITDKIERPTKDKEQFHIVAYNNNSPIRSYDILVQDIKKSFDLTKPFKLIFEWTGKGVKEGGKLVGINMETEGTKSKPTQQNINYPYPFSIIPFGAIMIGGTLGFFVGIYKGTVQLPKELKKIVIEGKEIMLGYTEYYYDLNERLALIKYFVPYARITNYSEVIYNKANISPNIESESGDQISEIFQIQYFYKDKSIDPYKTIIVEKVPELKEKEILF